MDAQPPFARQVIEALRRQCHLHPGSRVVVAVSGGADSVALLHVMASLRHKRRWHLQLLAGHVNHALREDATADARFVQALARQWDIPFAQAVLDPATRQSGNMEKWARHQRYAALHRMAVDFDAAAIVTAHHADDQLETMLMRLLRGAGAQALAGMAWSRRLSPSSPIMLHRPMLGVTHAQAVAYLQSLGIGWREDHTNTDTSRTRAALRASVLPTLAAIAPHYPRRVSQTSQHLREMAQMHQRIMLATFDELVSRDGASPTQSFERMALRRLPGALRKSVIRHALLIAGARADALGQREVSKLAAAVVDRQGGSRSFHFTSGITAKLTREALTIQSRLESCS